LAKYVPKACLLISSEIDFSLKNKLEKIKNDENMRFVSQAKGSGKKGTDP